MTESTRPPEHISLRTSQDKGRRTEAERQAEDTFSPKNGPVLLYDGECGVCSRSVQWILEHERRTALRFVPLQSALGKQLVRAAGISSDVDSLIFIEQSDGPIIGHKWSSAVLATLKYVGGPWRILTALQVVPSPIRDFAYRLFARHRLSFAPETCLIPSPETRSRFYKG